MFEDHEDRLPYGATRGNENSNQQIGSDSETLLFGSRLMYGNCETNMIYGCQFQVNVW